MTVQAASRMAIPTLTLETSADSPAAQVGPFVVGDPNDEADLRKFLPRVDLVTFESEFVRSDVVEAAARAVGKGPEAFIPSLASIRGIQDKLAQRRAYAAAGIPTPKAVALEDADDPSFPVVAKSRFGGYDGKGVRILKSLAEVDALRNEVAPGTWLLEDYIPFVRELACMVVIQRDGSTVTYPAVEVVNVDNVCDFTYPLEAGEEAQTVAVGAARAMAAGGSGLFGVEMFEDVSGRILVNEIAPRPHNTGHYTLDAGGVSQFEAHLRVVLGLPLPVELAPLPVGMVNVLAPAGARAEDWSRATEVTLRKHPEVHVHGYGKTSAKPGRKMGHLNAVAASRDEAYERLSAARRTFLAVWVPAS